MATALPRLLLRYLEVWVCAPLSGQRLQEGCLLTAEAHPDGHWGEVWGRQTVILAEAGAGVQQAGEGSVWGLRAEQKQGQGTDECVTESRRVTGWARFSPGEGRLCETREGVRVGVISKAGLSHASSPSGQRCRLRALPGCRRGGRQPSRPGRVPASCGARRRWGLEPGV